MSIELEGILEVDLKRGVIYFHDKATGTTKLRICQLPKSDMDISKGLNSIDITHNHDSCYIKQE